MPAATLPPANLPTRWYNEEIVGDDWVPAGTYVDWQSDEVRRFVYRLRTELHPRPSHREIATRYGFSHHLRSYRAQDAWQRRIRDEAARGSNTHRGAGDPRAYARNMRSTPAAPSRPGSRSDSSVTNRRFGIELEYQHNDGEYSADAIILHMRDEFNIDCRRSGYTHAVSTAWKWVPDGSVSGGELVSPIMAGDTASLDEVRDVIRSIKAQGGRTSLGVGMHVHVDATDFTTESSRRTMLEGLQNVEGALAAYCHRERTSGATSYGAGTLAAHEWDSMIRYMPQYTPGCSPNIANHDIRHGVSRYRFINIDVPLRKYGTVEFRGLGGTLHAGKMRVWVRVLQGVMSYLRDGYEFPDVLTPAELVSNLQENGYLGARTADKFVGECARRTAAGT